MAQPNALKSIAAERGQSIAEMMDQELTVCGTPFRVAVKLGVVENTTRRWYRLNGYVFEGGKWVKTSAESCDEPR